MTKADKNFAVLKTSDLQQIKCNFFSELLFENLIPPIHSPSSSHIVEM